MTTKTELYENFVTSQIALKEAKEQLKVLREERQKVGEAARWSTNGGLQARLDAFKAAVQPYEEKIAQADALVANLQARSDQSWEAYEAERMKPAGWQPSTDHTTPVLVWNQNHLRVKRTHSYLMTSWEMDGWRGLTTDLGKVVAGYGAPVEMGCFLVALVTIQCIDKRFTAYLAIQFKDGDLFDLAGLDTYCRCILCNQPGGDLDSKTLVCSECSQTNRHSIACLEAMRSQVIAQRLFLARWPHACLHCDVTGIIVGVPTQWEPGEDEDCPHCRKLGLCPRCGQHYGDDDNQCPSCSFEAAQELDTMPIISTWCPCPNTYYSIETRR